LHRCADDVVVRSALDYVDSGANDVRVADIHTCVTLDYIDVEKHISSPAFPEQRRVGSVEVDRKEGANGKPVDVKK
jgi:hypothetical protein